MSKSVNSSRRKKKLTGQYLVSVFSLDVEYNNLRYIGEEYASLKLNNQFF